MRPGFRSLCIIFAVFMAVSITMVAGILNSVAAQGKLQWLREPLPVTPPGAMNGGPPIPSLPPIDPQRADEALRQLETLVSAVSQTLGENRPAGDGAVGDAVGQGSGAGADTLFPPDASVPIPGFGPLAGWMPVPFGGALRTDAVFDSAAGYGIGSVEFTLPRSDQEISVEEVGLSIHEASGRIFYPSLELRRIPREITGSMQASGLPVVSLVGAILDQPSRATFRFIFIGETPLELEIRTPAPTHQTLTPRSSEPLFRVARDAWWKSYTWLPTPLEQRPDYPPMVENYLKSMLAARFGLPLPVADTLTPDWIDQLSTDLGVTGVTEGMRLGYVRRAFVSPEPNVAPERIPIESLRQSLPALPPGYFTKLTSGSEDEKRIEPLARCVPAECFYVRFGSFANLVRLQDLMGHWGGDAQNLLMTRAVNPGLQERFEQRLQQKLDAVTRLVGPGVVADVGIIGTDTFFQDGAAFGMVFLARNSFLFETSTNASRKKVAGTDPQTTLTSVEFPTADGKGNVRGTLLASTDGKIRSYYVRVGDHHCIASSERIAGRFVQACGGVEPLADVVDFQEVRTRIPTDRGDAAFVFASRAFLRNLASPEYRIELSRRLRAIAEQEMMLLAWMAGETEGVKLALTSLEPGAAGDGDAADGGSLNAESAMATLQEYGFLPAAFSQRGDGSSLQFDHSGIVMDSLRGVRGAFRPIPDVAVTDADAVEAKAYAAFITDFASRWPQMPSTWATVQRIRMKSANAGAEKNVVEQNKASSSELERIVVDASVTCLERKYTDPFVKYLGPAQSRELLFDPHERITFDVSLPMNQLFGAVREPGGAVQMLRTGVIPFRSLRDMVIGWFGFQGQPGLLATLHDRLSTRPDANGLRRGPLDLWVGQYDGCWIYSFQPELIPEVATNLQQIGSKWPAQVRLRIGDPKGDASLTDLIQVLSQGRAVRASTGNLRLLNQLSLQFRIAPEESLRIAEALLDAKLVDPLGGEYTRNTDGSCWVTTALNGTPNASGSGGEHGGEPPAPLLEWFRGVRIDAAADATGLTAHLETVMRIPDELRDDAASFTDTDDGTGDDSTHGVPEDSSPEPVSSTKNTPPEEPSIDDLLG